MKKSILSVEGCSLWPNKVLLPGRRISPSKKHLVRVPCLAQRPFSSVHPWLQLLYLAYVVFAYLHIHSCLIYIIIKLTRLDKNRHEREVTPHTWRGNRCWCVFIVLVVQTSWLNCFSLQIPLTGETVGACKLLWVDGDLYQWVDLTVGNYQRTHNGIIRVNYSRFTRKTIWWQQKLSNRGVLLC